jgi:hypothetical protein
MTVTNKSDEFLGVLRESESFRKPLQRAVEEGASATGLDLANAAPLTASFASLGVIAGFEEGERQRVRKSWWQQDDSFQSDIPKLGGDV